MIHKAAELHNLLVMEAIRHPWRVVLWPIPLCNLAPGRCHEPSLAAEAIGAGGCSPLCRIHVQGHYILRVHLFKDTFTQTSFPVAPPVLFEPSTSPCAFELMSHALFLTIGDEHSNSMA